ncbi:MAG TPA: hypothetical protein VI913_03290, partial [Candidatus Peribacteraceae bacterium]|nr:hypothetical protein [Candidatus Peribacteraceae bacterium]
GTLFYVYPYYWTYCISAEALLILWDLYHEKNWSARIQRILWTSLPLLIIALPWLIGAWQNRGDVLMAETLTRLGLIHTRWPKGPIHQLQAILAIAAIWWLARSKKDVAAAWPLLSFVGAALVVYNQAILTNAELEFSNHYSIISRISVQLAVVWLLMHLPTHYRWLQLSGVLAISALIILQTISWQNDVWNQFTTHAQSPNRSTDRAVMDALNALPTEQVIVTPLTFATDVAIYTPHYPFFSNATRLMPVANDELVMRARIMRQFFPGDKISPRMVVGTHHINLAVHKRIECRVFNLLPGRSVDCDSIKPEQFLSSLWQEFVTAQRFSGTELFSLLREKHVGYLLAENVPASLLSRLELVATIEPYKLYKLKV